MKIHIFNPDTDYALADGSVAYNPGAKIAALQHSMSDLPKQYADQGDETVAYDNLTPIADIIAKARSRGVSDKDIIIAPWGWNATLRHKLLLAGVDESMMPSEMQIAKLRTLAHRRTTIAANQLLNQFIIKRNISERHTSPLPIEFHTVDDALIWLDNNPRSIFKAPWSSSGRGLLFVPGNSNINNIKQWIKGTIKRQGSVMAEILADRAIDFATEWQMLDGKAHFVGLSLFKTSFRGKYHGNVKLSQCDILKEIQHVAPDFDNRWIEIQRNMLGMLIGRDYEGPLGIDMLSTHDGIIRGCIEINLRMTMGMATLLSKTV